MLFPNLPLRPNADAFYHERITRTDLIHHFLGNGKIQAVVQVTENPDCTNALVLHLMDPARWRPKSQSYTFHQQLGPEFTLVGLYTDNRLFVPHPRQTQADLKYGLDLAHGIPLFQASYPAAYTLDGEHLATPFDVSEELFVPVNHSAVLRRIRVTNRRGKAAQATQLLVFLTPNQALFPEAHYVTKASAVVAGHFERGDEFIAVAAFEQETNHAVGEFPLPFEDAADGVLGNHFVSMDDTSYVRPRSDYTNYPVLPGSPHLGAVLSLGFDLGALAPGESASIHIIYATGSSEKEVLDTIAQVRAAGYEGCKAETVESTALFATLQTGIASWDKLYLAARAGLRAGVAASGTMNAGLWGYNAEWVRDTALATVGATLSGQFDLARSMLDHLLTTMVSPEGLSYGESQWYDIQRAELDMNGELLYALWVYWCNTRDEGVIAAYWTQIERLAEFPLRPEFWVEEAGLVKSERDIRERDRERHGLLPGFELGHQLWVSIGLDCAADMAAARAQPANAQRWREMGQRIKTAVLSGPRFSFVEDGHFMKRRLLDGSFQRTAESKPYVHRTDDRTTKMYPRSLNRTGALEPDGFEALPIALGWVDGSSALARNTLARLETLWNQEWDFGGYPLQNVESEPTKLGPWPMILYFVTQAAHEAGDYDTVRRNLDWYLSTRDGRGYAWWEYIDADPAMQIDHGIIPWLIYGEPIKFLVHHLAGYRPHPRGITLRPRLMPEMQGLTARFQNGRHRIDLTIHGSGPVIRSVQINGAPGDNGSDGAIELPIPTDDLAVECWLGA